MFDRREFLKSSLAGSSLIAFSSTVPGFLARTAHAASPDKEKILVVLELNGGNDGVNTVIPYGDDIYHKVRPTLRFSKQQVVRIDDYLGFHPALRGLEQMMGQGQLAIVQGVGYPNPNRSHFESMDIWQTADPALKSRTGWLNRGLSGLPLEQGKIPGISLGLNNMPLAMQGPASGIVAVHPNKPFDLELGGAPAPSLAPPRPDRPTPPPEKKPKSKDDEAKKAAEQHRDKRRQLITDLTREAPVSSSMLPFVQRSALQTYSTLDRLREVMKDSRSPGQPFFEQVGRNFGELSRNLSLVARMIRAGFGTRIFYVTLGGFDTHASQADQHQRLLSEIANALTSFFRELDQAKESQRVVVLTFSEFGRRVDENGSRGTDHGAGSCLFLAGPAVKGGVVGKHPSLSDLGDGDLKFHTDFRQVYATLLDQWLGCNSAGVLGERFAPLPILKKA